MGASAWESGQLEREIKQGYWILCEGPSLCYHLQNALTGDYKYDPADTWHSFTKDLSKEDGELALVLSEDIDDENGLACDLL